jgi:glycosyltransferase involved in cell wall biosynthesis
MDRMNPMVSVIMPVYNAEKYIREAIDSILAQSYGNFELIIINDCPTDNSMNIVYTYTDKRIKIFNNKANSGIAYSRNVGLEYSQGRYIALMDDDDVSLPERLEAEVDFLEKRAEIDVVGGRCDIIDANGSFIRKSAIPFYNPKFIKAVYLFKNAYMNSTVMFRRKIIDHYDIRFRDNYLGMEDFRFWIECSKVCNMSNLENILLKYRKHSENESSRILEKKSEERKKLYAALQRYSLYESGFRLSEKQLQLINKVMTEKNGSCECWEEAKEFQAVLRDIVNQARYQGFDYCDELLVFCKKTWAQNLSNMTELWELDS